MVYHYCSTEVFNRIITGKSLMLSDISKDTVDFQPNYDDRLKEPQVLPSRFPYLLCNGSTGIAVGMATNIPPHNLNEVIDAMKLMVENPDCTLDDFLNIFRNPEFHMSPASEEDISEVRDYIAHY